MNVRAGSLIREAWASAISQPVASAVTIVVIAVMVSTVMLTTGRTVGTEQRVLGSIDDTGTRTIQVRAENDAGLTSGVLDRIRSIEGIEWAAAFSAAQDSTNAAIPDGARVPLRLAYGSNLQRLGVPVSSKLTEPQAFASKDALDLLGLPDVAGSIATSSGATYAVSGVISTPDFMNGFEPVLLAPQENDGDDTVNILLVIAERPDLVTPVSDAVVSVLAVDDPTKVSIQTSEAIAQLRAIVQTQLVSFSRGLVLVMLLISGVLVAVILYALVMMRRKDFGRRRALGATRGLIIVLLLTQTTILSLAGVTIGLSAAVVALVGTGDPLPGTAFTVSVGILAVATAVFAALLPACLASAREPIRELRVP